MEDYSAVLDNEFVSVLLEEGFLVEKEGEGKKKRRRGRRDCPVCGKVLTAPWHLRRHMEIHLPMEERAKPFSCDECGKGFLSLYDMRRHTFKHAGRTLSCDICGKTYKQKQDLATHYRLHSDPEANHCLICAFQFSSPSALRVHIKRGCPKEEELIQP